MTAVTYLEGRPRDHRGEQECILILSTAVTSSHASLLTSLLISSSLIPSLSLCLSLFVHTPALYLGYLAYSSIRPSVRLSACVVGMRCHRWASTARCQIVNYFVMCPAFTRHQKAQFSSAMFTDYELARKQSTEPRVACGEFSLQQFTPRKPRVVSSLAPRCDKLADAIANNRRRISGSAARR